MNEVLVGIVVVVLFIVGGVARTRRRARLSPEARALEDVAAELRRNRREMRRRER